MPMSQIVEIKLSHSKVNFVQETESDESVNSNQIYILYKDKAKIVSSPSPTHEKNGLIK